MTKHNQIEITAEQENLLMGFDATEYGNAKSVELLYGHLVKFVSQWGLLVYNGKFWERENAKNYLNTMVINTIKIRGKLSYDYDGATTEKKEAVKKACSTKNSCVMGATEAFLRLESILASHTDFDSNHYLLNVNNGVVDLRTGELLPHSPKYMFTTASPIDYNVNADYSLLVEQFKDTVLDWSNPEVSTFMQQVMGYWATGFISYEKLFYIHGPQRSGKSLILIDRIPI